MQRYKILHRTYYNFSAEVRLEPHSLRLRPREGHELRIESSTLKITPPATVRWHRDVEDNSVAIATFATPANQLSIESEVIVQQYDQAPLDFVVATNAADYPFDYTPEDCVVLAPFIEPSGPSNVAPVTEWLMDIWQPGEPIQTYALLQRLAVRIHQTLSYQLREPKYKDILLMTNNILYRNFGYLNNGIEQLESFRDLVQNAEGITQQDIDNLENTCNV